MCNFKYIFLFLFVIKTIADLILDILNYRHLKTNCGQIPPELGDAINAEILENSDKYNIDKIKFAVFHKLFNTIITIVFLF